MNETFVSIKVDREERPDIDRVYMTVAQALTGRGGWPLTIIMTPDKKPFFAATYIPKHSRFGSIGMIDLVPRIGVLWANRRADLVNTADRVSEALSKGVKPSTDGELDRTVLQQLFEELRENFDGEYGGFGTAPKFHSSHNLTYLLRYWKRTGNPDALDIVEKALDKMSRGGVYDHLGGGLHRYSTDREWRVPHFEKMLYDQALIVIAFIELFHATGSEEYAVTVRETVEYLLRDMRDEEGGFYSAEDADSEGEEGKFYLWTEEEIREPLTRNEEEAVIKIFNIETDGNYLDEASRDRTGRNIFYRSRPLKVIAEEIGIGEDDLMVLFEAAKEKLFRQRILRVRPRRDEKILTDWNGLTVAALAKAGSVLDERRYIDAATQAADFILESLRTPEGRLLHSYREDDTDIPAYVDDYAFLVWGLLELYESTFDSKYLREAVVLNRQLIDHFWDAENGGFYFSADDSERLLVRTKEFYDGAIPSGNSIAMMNLLRLGRITGDADLEERAAEIAHAVSSSVRRVPRAFTSILSALDFGLGPTIEVVVAGKKGAADTEMMLRVISREFAPHKVVVFRDPGENAIDSIAPWVENMETMDGSATAYVCVEHSCQLPTTDAGKLLESLRNGTQ